MEITTVCKSCDGTGFMNRETEWKQYCLDCVTGNTLALQACGSTLDPEKYPACHYDINDPGCNDQGIFPDGTSCDCDRVSILGFESLGYSHELAVKIMAVVTSCDYGCDEPLSTLVDKIDAARDKYGLIGTEATEMEKLFQEHPAAVQAALNHSWLARFI